MPSKYLGIIAFKGLPKMRKDRPGMYLHGSSKEEAAEADRYSSCRTGKRGASHADAF
jgi:hypothetical protein